MALNTYASTYGKDITTTYSLLLPSNTARNYFELQNRTGDDIFITIGGSESDKDAVILSDQKVFTANKVPVGDVKVRGNVSGRVIIME